MKISEKEIQKAVQFYLSDPSQIFELTDGKKIQVLSPGRINSAEGPDFLEIAILLNGKIIVGDAEFHRKSSNWLEHSHQNDSRYNSVILHIVFEEDIKLNHNFQTLIVDNNLITKIFNENFSIKKSTIDFFSLEELQNYSLIRLLRHTTEAQKIINEVGVELTLKYLTNNFLERYMAKRRRPVYNFDKIKELPERLLKSEVIKFINAISENERFSIPDKILYLLKNKIDEEGAALRREIILNVVLPICLTQADEESRVYLFVWYWSAAALNQYGNLTRKFPELPQNFLWQQQGMLEYLRELETSSNTISDTLNYFGIGNLLSFFQWGPVSS